MKLSHWSAKPLTKAHSVNPVHDQRRDKPLLRALWYYGWDCASGCIWDADAVAELHPLTPADAVREAAR